MGLRAKKCEHLEAVKEVKKTKTYECEACVGIGGSWVHLRTCQKCGVTLCCDSSPNKHARKHAESHKHPVISSAEPNEKWLWCYEHKTIMKYT
ncbi:UBP-type zinc finger domain-containing protein [Allomuricauda sp. SCSIO 65647]|uniref:UBP-type zinc finger domain-containing protein n=1 Tax=Allomuricauda sp. SCSIO 65647 TaxID=2908843 RepID=UPI001F2F9312|nr:UBP-type zinc finger domain-containing protein [Muricauda sp. SCSIO 65647]UJH66052.1 UBP-type zinc finger domain-containing protein [Muricauda sp. SCSIO 65647]